MTPFNNKADGSGYWVINLRVDGKVKCRCVSELVLTTFVGPRPSPIHDAAHVNGDRNVNALDNLVWATKKENAAHKRLHGTHRPRRRCTWVSESSVRREDAGAAAKRCRDRVGREEVEARGGGGMELESHERGRPERGRRSS
jgi:hypothetical protein